MGGSQLRVSTVSTVSGADLEASGLGASLAVSSGLAPLSAELASALGLYLAVLAATASQEFARRTKPRQRPNAKAGSNAGTKVDAKAGARVGGKAGAKAGDTGGDEGTGSGAVRVVRVTELLDGGGKVSTWHCGGPPLLDGAGTVGGGGSNGSAVDEGHNAQDGDDGGEDDGDDEGDLPALGPWAALQAARVGFWVSHGLPRTWAVDDEEETADVALAKALQVTFPIASPPLPPKNNYSKYKVMLARALL